MPNWIDKIGTYYSGTTEKRGCWICHSDIKEGDIILVLNNTRYCKKCGKSIVEKAKENHQIKLDAMLEELMRED